MRTNKQCRNTCGQKLWRRQTPADLAATKCNATCSAKFNAQPPRTLVAIQHAVTAGRQHALLLVSLSHLYDVVPFGTTEIDNGTNRNVTKSIHGESHAHQLHVLLLAARRACRLPPAVASTLLSCRPSVRLFVAFYLSCERADIRTQDVCTRTAVRGASLWACSVSKCERLARV